MGREIGGWIHVGCYILRLNYFKIYICKVKKFVKFSLSYCSFNSAFQASRYYHKVGILMETH